MSVPGPSCRLSVRGVNPPVCCVLAVTCVRGSGGGGGQTSWHRAYSSSPWHCLGHSQGSLQCHFSRCKVGSFKGLRVRIVLVDAFTDLMRCRK